jgi:hypothetical protein
MMANGTTIPAVWSRTERETAEIFAYYFSLASNI